MKKAYLITIYLITLTCMIIGIIIHVSKWNGFNVIKPDSLKVEEYDADLNIATTDQISIKIDSRIGDVKIEKGDRFHLKYSAISSVETEVTVEENEIIIEQKSNVKNFGNVNGMEITLTVPADISIKMLDVHNDLGDIWVDGINCTEGKVDENLGDIKVQNCKFTDMEINNDLGDIKVIDCGKFEDYKIDAEVALGEIRFFDGKYGDEFKREGKAGSLTIDNSLGDITIK